MNKHSVREYPAHWAYSESYNIPKKQHAIERQKQLLAFALGYEYQNNILNYGIEKSSFIKPDLELPKKYALLVQNASWPSKLWSVDKWQKIVKYLESNKIYSLFPSGNMHELESAKKISKIFLDIFVWSFLKSCFLFFLFPPSVDKNIFFFISTFV